MRILALDTTTPQGSLALLEDERLLEERILPGPDGFGQILFQAIRDLLAAHDVTLASIDLFAGAAGPGTFTGVRIGLTAIKGLAEAQGKPALGVSNLQALAAYGTSGRRAVWIDARRGEIYGAVYDEHLRLVQNETVTTMENWKAGLPAGEHEFIELTNEKPLAAAIARIARRQGGVDPAAVDANYIRRSDAELHLQPPV
jgi:tRNA threonylcarbamoyladenosine biosynthesis protein TsaB